MVDWGKGEPIEAWQDRMLREQGIEVAMPKQTDRAAAWLDGVKRMTDLREKRERGECTGAELRELDELWRRYPPDMPPKPPATYGHAMRRITEVKARLDDPRTSDTVFNRLSWNYADLINLLATKVERGEWFGDARLRDVLDPPVDGQHRRVTGDVDTVDKEAHT